MIWGWAARRALSSGSQSLEQGLGCCLEGSVTAGTKTSTSPEHADNCASTLTAVASGSLGIQRGAPFKTASDRDFFI